MLATCDALAGLHDVEVTFLPVNGEGLVDPQALAAAIRTVRGRRLRAPIQLVRFHAAGSGS